MQLKVNVFVMSFIRRRLIAMSVLVLCIMLVTSLVILANRLPSESSLQADTSHSESGKISSRRSRFYSRAINSRLAEANETLYGCPLVSPHLIGWTDLSALLDSFSDESPDTFEVRMKNAGVKEGGKYSPNDCLAQSKVAIIVPYRNLKTELNVLDVFLRYMHPFLQRQQLDYTIFVVEQADDLPFNRGMLFNIGYVEAQLRDSFHCFIFHGVDLVPEDDRNMYSCPEEGRPRHLSSVIDIHKYKPLSLMVFFGGVIAVSTLDYARYNGFSNAFWGVGLEDDDFYLRIRRHNVTVTRPHLPTEYLKYRTFYGDHPIKPNPDRQQVFDRGLLRFETDGLINLQYNLDSFRLHKLYTHLIVRLQKF